MVNPQGETKYFNSIQGWRIEAIATNQMSGNGAPPNPQTMDTLRLRSIKKKTIFLSKR